MLTEEIKQQAVLWEGPEGEGWEFLGMKQVSQGRLRYYRTPEGNYYFTVQTLGRQFVYEYEVRENPDRTLSAKRIMPKRRRKSRWRHR